MMQDDSDEADEFIEMDGLCWELLCDGSCGLDHFNGIETDREPFDDDPEFWWALELDE